MREWEFFRFISKNKANSENDSKILCKKIEDFAKTKFGITCGKKENSKYILKIQDKQKSYEKMIYKLSEKNENNIGILGKKFINNNKNKIKIIKDNKYYK